MSPADPDLAAAIESLFDRGVTDGLPVVPPSRRLVERAVAASGRDFGELVALGPPDYGRRLCPAQPHARGRIPKFRAPEHIKVMVAGDTVGRFSVIVPGWTFSKGSNVVFRRIRR